MPLKLDGFATGNTHSKMDQRSVSFVVLEAIINEIADPAVKVSHAGSRVCGEFGFSTLGCPNR
jgi:hypothetical protein